MAETLRFVRASGYHSSQEMDCVKGYVFGHGSPSSCEDSAAVLQVVVNVVVETFPSVLRNLNNPVQLGRISRVISRVLTFQLDKGDKDTTWCQYG